MANDFCCLERDQYGECGHVQGRLRPRRGDLEEAVNAHPFQPSGEFVEGKERCDLRGLVQRGLPMHQEKNG